MTTTRVLAALFAVGLLLTSSSAADPDDRAKLLAETSVRHREALDAIRTVSFAFGWTELKNEPLHYSRTGYAPADAAHETGPGRYWQTTERWRSSALWSDGSTTHDVYRHHTFLTLWTPPGGDLGRTAKLTSEQATPWTWNGRDRLAWLLFGHPGLDTIACIPFYHLLEQPHTLHAVERLPTPNGDTPGEIRVEMSHTDGRYEFWFSPKHNHLIRKRVWHPADEPQHRHEVEVTQFAEPNPGQFFPTAIEYRAFEKGKLKFHNQLTLTELQVNRPVPNEMFRIPHIDGMVCKDITQNRSFKVDADGYRVGESTPGEVDPPRVRGPSQPVPPSVEQSIIDLPWWAWAAIAALLLCLIAAVMEIRRLRALPPPAPPR